MKRFTIALLLFVLQASPAFADENCSELEDPFARLKCFDRNYPSVTSPAPITPPGEENAGSRAEDAQLNENLIPTSANEPIETETVVVTESKKSVSEEKKPARTWKNMFDFGEKIDLSATVVDLLKKDKQRMVFKLDNDQIWIQTTPRSLPIKKGDNVTIRSATFGGFILRTEGGTSTRVSMLENE